MTLRWHPGRWWLGVAGALVALLCAGFAWGEWAGWPWLAQPLAKGLGQRLGRQVQFGADGAGGLQLHLIGGVRLQADRLQVAPPAWATDRPPTLDAHGVQLDLRYRDLLAGWRGGGLAVQRLQAERLALDRMRMGRRCRSRCARWPCATAPRSSRTTPGR
jgi:AsmA family protein